MSEPQKGVCAEPNLHALYLLLNVTDDDAQAVRAKLARLLELFDHYEEEYYEAMVTGLIGIGCGYWQELYPGPIPTELSAFPDVQCEDRSAPALQTDLFIQIRTDRLDVSHAMGIDVMDLMRLHVELVESVSGFRYLDGRDLNGFVYAADNPRGMKRREVAIIDENIPVFGGGSYIHTQRFRHDLRRWNALSERQQEQVMGVTREHNLPSAEQSASSHVVRATAQGLNDDLPQLLLQGMPYGDMSHQGLFSVTCSASSRVFKDRLYSQIVGTSEGDYDRWLDFTSAETGGAYFAPSIQFIKDSVNSELVHLF